MSLFMLSGAIAQVNALLLGFAADILGMETLLIGTAALCTAMVVLAASLVPTLRHLDRATGEAIRLRDQVCAT